MKRMTLLLVCMFSMVMVVMASSDKPITVEQLPQTARQFIQKHFSAQTVAVAKMETDFMNKSYDVIFTNGDKLEFDKRGQWTSVDCAHNQVPVDILPAPIREYVGKMYPTAKVLQVELTDRKGYELELSNGLEIKFDKKMNVIDLDR